MSFYKTADLYVPEIKFRQVKIRTSKGFKCARRKFHTMDQLREWLVDIDEKQGILDVYYSLALWFNPHKVRGKWNWKHSKWADRILLGTDFVMDFDKKDYGVTSSDAAEEKFQDNVMKGFAFLRIHGFDKIDFVNTGRGIHLVVRDFSKRIPYGKEPHNRRQEAHAAMKRLASKAKEWGVVFDVPVSKDLWRIVRVPGSRPREGHLCFSYSLHGVQRTPDAMKSYASMVNDTVHYEVLPETV